MNANDLAFGMLPRAAFPDYLSASVEEHAMLTQPLRALTLGLLTSATLYGASAVAAPAPVNIVNGNRDFFDAVATVLAGDQGASAGVLIAKAPADKALIITDLVMTHNVNTTTATFRANFRRGPASNPTDCETAGLVLGPYVSPEQTVSIDLSTGLRLNAGEQLCLAVGGAGAGEGITVALSGYEAPLSAGP